MIASLALTLTLRAPWLSRDNHVGLFGIDAPLARLPGGQFYLPGTLLVGRLAEAFDHLAQVDSKYGCAAATFLPRNGMADLDAQGREARRRLFISDLVLQGGAAGDGLRTRIAIDPASGTVADGAMQVIEAPLAAGAEAQFAGTVRLLGTENECRDMAAHLQKALRWLTQVGGGRTYGHGVVDEVSLGADTQQNTAAQPAEGQRLQLRITAHDPLCVGEKRTSPNSYQSSEVIAGGVIKGALANTVLTGAGKAGPLDMAARELDKLSDLATNFSALHISHGFPVKKEKGNARPSRAAFSIAQKDGSFADMALLVDPEAPQLGWKLAPDWKDTVQEAFDALTGWSAPKTDFRIRTAIDKSHRSADEGRLFAIEYRRPDTHDWIAHVDVEGKADAGKILAQLNLALKDGLAGVGRGGAYCSVAIAARAPQAAQTVAKGDRLILTLQTPALLRKPVPGATGDVTEGYRTAFSAIGLPGLKSIFIREQLHGGQFFAHRLPKGTAYKPWLLTRAGSCFVFEVGDGPPDLTSLARFGLAVPVATAEFYAPALTNDAWKYCPYLPENGYSEVHLQVVKAGDLLKEPKALEAWP